MADGFRTKNYVTGRDCGSAVRIHLQINEFPGRIICRKKIVDFFLLRYSGAIWIHADIVFRYDLFQRPLVSADLSV